MSGNPRIESRPNLEPIDLRYEWGINALGMFNDSEHLAPISRHTNLIMQAMCFALRWLLMIAVMSTGKVFKSPAQSAFTTSGRANRQKAHL